MPDLPSKVRRRVACGFALIAAVCAASGCQTRPVSADLAYFPEAPATPRAVHLKSLKNLRQLVPADVRFVDLIRGVAPGPYVDRPAGIAYRGGHLYICDAGLGVVHDWDLETGRARRLGARGETILAKPVAVAVDEGEGVYVADTDRGEVVAFDPGGVAVRRFKVARDDFKPVAVAVAERRLYVADIRGHRVEVFSTDDGTHIDGFGGVGSEPGTFYFPMGLAVTPDGGLLVSDMMNARVQAFDARRKFTGSMGRPGNRYGDMGKPRQVAVGPDGVIFVADAEFAHVHLYGAERQLLMMLGGADSAVGATPMPVGIAVATELPSRLSALVPDDFDAAYYLFVSNSVGSAPISLYAIGVGR